MIDNILFIWLWVILSMTMSFSSSMRSTSTFWRLKLTLLVHATDTGIFWCFHNPPNSNTDKRTLILQGALVYCLMWRTFVQRAQNLPLKKSRAGWVHSLVCKLQWPPIHVLTMLDHTQPMGFESEYSHSAQLTLSNSQRLSPECYNIWLKSHWLIDWWSLI